MDRPGPASADEEVGEAVPVRVRQGERSAIETERRVIGGGLDGDKGVIGGEAAPRGERRAGEQKERARREHVAGGLTAQHQLREAVAVYVSGGAGLAA